MTDKIMIDPTTELETLRTAFAEIKEKNRKLKARVAELETNNATIKVDAETAAGALTARLEQVEARAKQRIVRDIASQLFMIPRFGEKYVADRITVRLDEAGETEVVVTDEAGKPTKLSLDDLKKELRENKEFAPLLIGSRAQGGGATGSTGGGSTLSSQQQAPSAKKVLAQLGLR